MSEENKQLKEPLIRSSSRMADVSMSKDIQPVVLPQKNPVLNTLFSSVPPRVQDSKPRRRLKSDLYTVFNPRSRQISAVCFKYFISVVIIIDFIVFVVSTEPVYRQEGKYAHIFDAVEGITSVIFLLEYVARLYTIVESKKYAEFGPFWGRVHFMTRVSSIVDLLATIPFFLEMGTGWELPKLTYLRTFRLLRIMKTSGFAQAIDAVWRVLYYNRQIMYMSVFVGMFMILTTSIVLFYLRPRGQLVSEDFESMLSTMYLSTLLLTGSSSVGDLPEIPWYTKGAVLLTSAFSIGMFAIPASMLTWGFEAEAARCAKRQYQLKKRQSNGDEESTDEYSTDEEYQKIIADEGADEGEEDQTKKAMLQFMQADADGSGTMSLKEFIELTRQRPDGDSTNGGIQSSDPKLESRLDALETKVDAINTNLERLCRHLKAPTN